eukprot:TRINITY_DN74684_c0_g1_i1.p1 TRINITY_DN74684_c0_g1~~TRINITY_DN74684_c0_g1_i1.p1  ORF type:complete len:340 (-),score=55.78 TRINITY_DN74684_c0_g1_i1:41-1021(-)
MGLWGDVSPAAAFSVAGYMVCSATLLVANKYAVHLVPAPSFILIMQLAGTVVAVKVAQALRLIAACDSLELQKAKAFFPVALIFTATIFTNIASLRYANVETFMVFRFSTPLVISIADYVFLGRELPSMRSWLCLVALLGGAVGYTMVDSFFDVRGYVFCAFWYVLFCTDQIYLKHVVDTVKMESTWGRVYYSNLLSCVPLMVVSMGSQEQTALTESITPAGVCAIGVTVIMGAAMSYFAWSARAALSATMFTICGNVCKILTIVINLMLWDRHANPQGLLFLGVSFAGAYFYQQAPLRRKEVPTSEEELPALSCSADGPMKVGKV